MIRLFLILEVLVFAGAAMFHFGVFVEGYEHPKARIAESVIGVVLLAGLIISLISPASTGQAALWVQGFALFGTIIGIFTIVVGVGPRTLPDVLFNVSMVLLLTAGLIIAKNL